MIVQSRLKMGTGTVTLSASDTSKIIADAGGVGIAAAGGQGVVRH